MSTPSFSSNTEQTSPLFQSSSLFSSFLPLLQPPMFNRQALPFSPEWAVGLTIIAYVSFKALKFLIWEPLRSPLEALPGPKKPGVFFKLDNLRDVMDTFVSQKKQQEYREKYGKNIRIQGFGYWDQRLLTFDLRAINYILVQATELYPKAWQSRRLLSRLLGDGVAVTEGEQHRRQRKVIMPAFAPASLRRLTPVFKEKAEELVARLSDLIQNGETELDVNHWIGRATFDAFALAGFDYNLNVIQSEDHELYLAYKRMFDVAVNQGQTLLGFLEVYVPLLSRIVPNEAYKQIQLSRRIIQDAADNMFRCKRDAISRSKAVRAEEDVEGEPLVKDQKDILSLLIKANLAEAKPSQRLSDAEILAQIHSFLFVGSDSVSVAIDWTLHHLSQNQPMQTRLREELLKEGVDSPYLDAVVRENLRLIAPLQGTLRVAAQDDVIPTEDGSGVRIAKGQLVHLPIEAMNTAKEIWGDDAWEFNPDRWYNLPEAAKSTPGLIPGLMSFSVGSHACPAFQFAIMEAKSFITALVTSFEFNPVPGRRIVKINNIVVRPYVYSEWKQGSQLPMLIKPYVPVSPSTANL